MQEYNREKSPKRPLSREEIRRRERIRAYRLRKKRSAQQKFIAICVVILALIICIIWGIVSFIGNTLDSSKEASTEAADSGIEVVVPEEPLYPPEYAEFFELPYAKDEYSERYLEYKNENPDLSTEDIVTHCNMGIDVPFFTRDAIEVDDPYAIDTLVNKVYKLPDGFEPNNLLVIDSFRSQTMQEPAALAFQSMKEACKSQGFEILAYSGFRSYDYQNMIYNNSVNVKGQAHADAYIARPGHSEHGLGMSVDVSINGGDYNECHKSPYYSKFYNTLADYGFIVRYPEGKEDLTGYSYESWHIRYVGVEIAKELETSGLTLDEYIARRY